MSDTFDLDPPPEWPLFLLVAFLLALALFGCSGSLRFGASERVIELDVLTSRHTAEFFDVDGTRFNSRLSVAAFSKLEEGSARMGYTWTPDGDGSITVGRSEREVDQSGQIEALGVAIESAIRAAVVP